MFNDNQSPSEDDIKIAKEFLAEIMLSTDPRKYRLNFKKKSYYAFSKKLRYSSEKDVQNILKTIEWLIEKTYTSVERMRLNTIIEGATEAFKDFQRWGCQIARYSDPDDMSDLAWRYTNEREIQLKEEMWFGEQSFRDAENALTLCTNSTIQPSTDGPLSFLADTVSNNQWGLRIAFEYLMKCHYENALSRETLKEDAIKMYTARTEGRITGTPMTGSYEWAAPLVGEMCDLAKKLTVADLAYSDNLKGYILIYNEQPLSYFNYEYEDKGPCWLHGRDSLAKHWPRLESLFHTVINFPLDSTQKKSLETFYDYVIELIWLIGQTTPAIRGSGKLAEQCLTMIHLKHNLRTPILDLKNPQLDVLDITFPLSIYKKRFFNFFEKESIHPLLSLSVPEEKSALFTKPSNYNTKKN